MRMCEMTGQEFDGPGYMLARDDGQPVFLSAGGWHAIREAVCLAKRVDTLMAEVARLAARVEELEDAGRARGQESAQEAPRMARRKAAGAGE